MEKKIYTEQKAFLLYRSFITRMEKLTMEERAILFTNVFYYVNDRELIEMPRLVDLVFTEIKEQIDRDAEKYEEIAETRRKNGAKGGRPKASSKTEPAETEVSENKTERLAKKPNGFLKNQSKAKKPNINAIADKDAEAVAGVGAVAEAKAKADTAAPTHTAHTHENKIPYAEYVTLTPSEYDTLTRQFGKSATERMICIVSDHKGLRPNNYRGYNDFYAIKTWGKERYDKEKARSAPPPESPSSYSRDDLESFWDTH